MGAPVKSGDNPRRAAFLQRMGAAAGPVGALVGGVVGLGVGLMQKKKFKKNHYF